MLRLEARRLSRSFGGPPIFAPLDFSFESGLIAVTGRNGSGKSTLLKIWAGLMRATGGSLVLREGERAIGSAEVRRRVGWCSPEMSFPGTLTAVENLRWLAGSGGIDVPAVEIRGLLARLGLSRAADRRVSEFSSGMLQRVRLAFSLLGAPDVLLWDEPFSNLDVAGIAAAKEVATEQRRRGLVLLATNDRSDLDAPEDEIGLS